MRLALIPLIGLAASCSAFEPTVPPPQEIAIRVSSDPGRPIKGAQLLFNGQVVATTTDDGVGRMRLEGKEGETFDIMVRCPDTYQSPPKATQVILRRLADPTKRPEYVATCPPMIRTVVVAVRADQGPNLPVLYMGREIARTDTSGSAHVLLQMRPDEQFDLVISTAEKGNELMRPQNPQSTFFVKQKDDLFTFDTKFIREKVRPKVGPKHTITKF